jgi:hypothetical protein
MFDHLKYLLIEYVHLIFPIVIIIGIYINNMPINFRFEVLINKLLSLLTGPGGEFNIETAKKLGIEDPNSKLYKLVSYIYIIIKSSISPSYKTMLFKLSLIIFLTGILLGVSYSNMFMVCCGIVSVLSIIFYLIFATINYIGEKKDSDKQIEGNEVDDENSKDKKSDESETTWRNKIYEWLHTNIDSIQLDDWSLILLNYLPSTIFIIVIWFVFHNILNDTKIINNYPNDSFKHNIVERLNSLSSKIKKNPSNITICMLFLISLLYLRADGFTYLCIDVANYIKYNWGLWRNNMTKGSWPRRIGQLGYFVIYLSIFFMIIFIQYGKKGGTTVGNLNISFLDKIPGLGDMKLNDISIFNNLIQHTNHPKIVLVFYVYYFLLRTEYGFGWIFNFMLLTGGDIAFKMGLAKKLAVKAAGKMPSNVTNGLDNLASNVKGAAVSMGAASS